jgi:hypothetical protein
MTHTAAKWTLPSMYIMMSLQAICIAEYFIAHIAVMWMLPSVSLQVTSIIECFIAHITAIWKLLSMDIMSHQASSIAESFIAHISVMDASQYVDADEPSDVVFSCMFYYTYHRDMYVLQYVTTVKKKKKEVIVLF